MPTPAKTEENNHRETVNKRKRTKSAEYSNKQHDNVTANKGRRRSVLKEVDKTEQAANDWEGVVTRSKRRASGRLSL